MSQLGNLASNGDFKIPINRRRRASRRRWRIGRRRRRGKPARREQQALVEQADADQNRAKADERQPAVDAAEIGEIDHEHLQHRDDARCFALLDDTDAQISRGAHNMETALNFVAHAKEEFERGPFP